MQHLLSSSVGLGQMKFFFLNIDRQWKEFKHLFLFFFFNLALKQFQHGK